MYSVFAMWRSLVFYRLSQNSKGAERNRNFWYPGYMVPAREEPGSTVPRYVVPEPGTSGARYPRIHINIYIGKQLLEVSFSLVYISVR